MLSNLKAFAASFVIGALLAGGLAAVSRPAQAFVGCSPDGGICCGEIACCEGGPTGPCRKRQV